VTEDDLRDVLNRHLELRSGLPEHVDEVIRLAARILDAERHPPSPPELPPALPAWEIAYWAQRSSRGAGSPGSSQPS
jgi:hypothetical protein